MNEPDRHQLGPLLDRLAAGDRSALNELFGRIRPYLHALVCRTLGNDWKDASDIVQSSLRRINENIGHLLDDDPSVTHLLAWIKKIVRNRAIDEARRRAGMPLAGHDSFLGNVPERQSPREAALREARSLEILSALRELPERQRLVVELHYFDRLKDNEISERLGGSVAAIRVLRCRALKELRRRLEANHATE